MREIKFRAWHNAKKEMQFYEFLTYAPPNYMALDLMQYTGLKDKNGKEIYEGDVLEWEDRRVIDSRVIEFSDGGFWLVGKTNEPWKERFMPSEPTREIIGNIYENPELIKT